jgi:hypothetical protein
MKPSFLITIDTEGDNLWAQPREITTRNSNFLPRFQSLCERFGFQPTYLTNYEMAMCPVFREFAADALRRGKAEVGMHLHAWNSPPVAPLTADDFAHQPFLIEYPVSIMREKIVFMTRLLEDTFQTAIHSHRAGRWSFNKQYARILVENGYRTDCSVTPLISWKASLGDPNQSGGTDFSAFPRRPYFMDLDDIGRPGDSPLLELPMTIVSLEPALAASARRRLNPRSWLARALGRLYPPVAWLRPDGSNVRTMTRIVKKAAAERSACVEFMLHSSEFMPGGSPTFPTEASIEQLYEHLEETFALASLNFAGATLSEFAANWGHW